MRRMRKILGAVLTLLACGDPRADFVGTYEGSVKRTWSWGDSITSPELSFDIVAPKGSDRVQLAGDCGMTAEVVDDDTLRFDPVSCPSYSGTSKSGVKATYQMTYSGGAATLTNKTLVIAMQGTQFGSNYADKSPNQSFSFREEMTITKR